MTLEKLARTHELEKETPDKRELEGLVKAARERLADAENSSLSYTSRYDLAYSAAHGLALAALRASGYHTEKHHLVFQCLVHTTEIDKKYVQLLAACHDKRKLAEYEGHFDEDEALLSELITCTKKLITLVDEIRL